jgi:hypothetical protein
VTAANLKPLWASSAWAQERSEPDVSSEAETVQTAGSRANTIEISFGSFRLLPAQRRLLDGNKPVRLGSRALDVLIALVERPNELVSKEQLMTRVWPRTFVHPRTWPSICQRCVVRCVMDGTEAGFLSMSQGAAIPSMLRLKFMVRRYRLMPSFQPPPSIIHPLTLIA